MYKYIYQRKHEFLELLTKIEKKKMKKFELKNSLHQIL